MRRGVLRFATAVLIVVVGISGAHAEEGSADAIMARIEALFSPADMPERYALEVLVSVYPSSRDIAPYSFPVSIGRWGERWRRTTADVTVLSTPTAMVVVDRSRKTIRYAFRAQRPPVEAAMAMSHGAIAAFRDKRTRVVDAASDAGGSRIVLENDHTLIRRIEVLLEGVAAERLRRIRYEYRSGVAGVPDSVVLQFNWLNATEISDAEFSEDVFVLRRDGRIVPAAAFATFKMIEMDGSDEVLDK